MIDLGFREYFGKGFKCIGYIKRPNRWDKDNRLKLFIICYQNVSKNDSLEKIKSNVYDEFCYGETHTNDENQIYNLLTIEAEKCFTKCFENSINNRKQYLLNKFRNEPWIDIGYMFS